MSWWSNSEIENEILKATSSSIPSGEQDSALNLEISDSVRSKQASSKVVLNALRKRLYDQNPNVQISALHLLDLLVKNGGNHFSLELTSKEFIDAYVAQLLNLQNQNRSPEVVDLMLEYLQTWALASGNKPEVKYLRDKYEELKRRRDIVFPDTMGDVGELSSTFLESATAPEWVDSDTCMKSGQPFTFYNRKHHCRNCGGVFSQEYCSNFRTLPHYGINIPVRICTDCNAKSEQKYSSQRAAHINGHDVSEDRPTVKGSGSKRVISSNNADIGSAYREDLAQAISLSLNATKLAKNEAAAKRNPTLEQRDERQDGADEEEMDEDMKKAIEASSADLNISQKQPNESSQLAKATNTVTPSQPVEALQKPPASEPSSPPKDKAILNDFISSVQTSNPHDAIYNQHLVASNQSAIQLQPKVITELRESSKKLAILDDLHGKLMAVSSYYNRLLDAELSPESGLERAVEVQQDAPLARQNIEPNDATVPASELHTEYYAHDMQDVTNEHLPSHQPEHEENKPDIREITETRETRSPPEEKEEEADLIEL